MKNLIVEDGILKATPDLTALSSDPAEYEARCQMLDDYRGKKGE